MSSSRFSALAVLCMPLVLQGCVSHSLSGSNSPGTPTRPLLSATEAQQFTQQQYFAQGGLIAQPQRDNWQPEQVNVLNVSTPWVVGENAQYRTVQQAVNAALLQAKGQERIWIKVLPGTYKGTVYLPSDAPPITLFGAGENPEQVTIKLALDSMISPEVWRKTVNPDGQYKPGDPAWYMYQTCAVKKAQVVATTCAAVVWSQNNGFQLANLTVENSLLDTVDGSAHQGVALRTDGDKVQIDNVRLIGRQDTFFVNTSDKNNRYVTDRISRVYIKDSYIEGDVDYVFGRANAVFENVHFHTVSTRGSGEAFVLAPNTLPDNPYGFLVQNSRFTTDEGFEKGFYAKLGRAWDQGAKTTGYLPGKTSNSQVVIKNSSIDGGYDPLSPWGSAATTQRAFKGNNQPGRDLGDMTYNRLWEFNNRLVQE